MGIIELSEFLRRKIIELGITKAELARRSRLSRSFIYKILNCELTSFSEDAMRRLAFALKVTSAELHHLLWKGALKKKIAKTSEKPLVENDESIFIRDVTYPDNEMVHVNQEFEKVWEIRNIGSVPWKGRFLQRVDSPEGEGALICEQDIIPLPSVMPGEAIKIAIKFKAPAHPCTTISYWKMVDKEGKPFFPEKRGLWCRVMVIVTSL